MSKNSVPNLPNKMLPCNKVCITNKLLFVLSLLQNYQYFFHQGIFLSWNFFLVMGSIKQCLKNFHTCRLFHKSKISLDLERSEIQSLTHNTKIPITNKLSLRTKNLLQVHTQRHVGKNIFMACQIGQKKIVLFLI